jgi:hypothetical protein
MLSAEFSNESYMQLAWPMISKSDLFYPRAGVAVEENAFAFILILAEESSFPA